MNWHLQDAKNHFSKVVDKAITEGPQTVTRRGKPAVVVLSAKAYGELTAGKPNFIEYLLSGPEWDDEFIEEINRRPRYPERPVDL